MRTRFLIRVFGSLLCAIFFTGLLSYTAWAHPLGNTSVNVYERLTTTSIGIDIRFVLDISEIPALREKDFADTNDDGTVDDLEATAYLNSFWDYLKPNMHLTANNETLDIRVLTQALTFPPGQGGLNLMRAVYDLTADGPTDSDLISAELTETTFEGVPGWHEIVVQGGSGTELVDSSVPDHDLTNELTAYPPDMLTNPLSVREATFSYRSNGSTASAAPSSAAASASAGPIATQPTTTAFPPPPQDPLVGLLGDRLTAATALLGLAVAAALGALHAISPGHGKTLVAAYMVGTRADIRKGVWLGITVAVTHTAGIFILGAATLAFTALVVPERIVSWLSIATGLLIIALGGVLVWRSRVLTTSPSAAPPIHNRSKRNSKKAGRGHSHGQGQAHSHGPADHDHGHPTTPDLRHRDVAMLGIVGGLVPSGSALLLLLSAVALNQVAYGLLLIVAFGVGMALVLTGMSTGVAILRRTPALSWESWRNSRVRSVAVWLPTISGLIVVGLGVWLTADAIRNFV